MVGRSRTQHGLWDSSDRVMTRLLGRRSGLFVEGFRHGTVRVAARCIAQRGC